MLLKYISLNYGGKNIIEALNKNYESYMDNGFVGFWKINCRKKVTEVLRKNGEKVIYLDGDELRNIFKTNNLNINNYSRERRLELAMQYSYLCRLIVEQKITVVIATISMFKEIYSWKKKTCPDILKYILKFHLMSYDEEIQNKYIKNLMMVN